MVAVEVRICIACHRPDGEDGVSFTVHSTRGKQYRRRLCDECHRRKTKEADAPRNYNKRGVNPSMRPYGARRADEGAGVDLFGQTPFGYVRQTIGLCPSVKDDREGARAYYRTVGRVCVQFAEMAADDHLACRYREQADDWFASAENLDKILHPVPPGRKM